MDEHKIMSGIKSIDEIKLIKLVRKRQSIWNFELKPEERNITRRKLAWSEIEQRFNYEYKFADLKLGWKRVRERYVKSLKSQVEPDIENDFMKSMSFLFHNDLEENFEDEKDEETEPLYEQPSEVLQTNQINYKRKIIVPKLEEIDEIKLIKLVRRRESIWNEELRKEKNNSCRKLAWSEIQKHFNCNFTIVELKRGWKRIRERYLNQKKKLTDLGHSSSVDEPIFKNDFMKSMSFLDGNCEGLEDQETEEFCEQYSPVLPTNQINYTEEDPTVKHKIDETKLIKLVRKRESIWNGALKKARRTYTRRKWAWSEVERDFDHVFTVAELKLEWKRLRLRYLSWYKNHQQIEIGSQSSVDENIFENDFIKSMTFLNHGMHRNDEDEESKPMCDSTDVLPDVKSGIDEMKLIKLIRKKGVLWNFELKNRSKTRRDFAWSEIERDFDYGFTVAELKLGWKRVRERYLKTKRNETADSPVENDFLEAMSFVNKFKPLPYAAIVKNEVRCVKMKRKKKLKPLEVSRYKKRKQQKIKQIFLPETNPTEIELPDSLLPIKTEPPDNLDVEMISDNCVADVKIENQERACRACLLEYTTEETHKFFLNYTYIDGVELGALYKEYIGYNSTNSESLLPVSICNDCQNALLEFHEFRKKCRSNETTFMEAVRILKGTEVPTAGEKDESAKFDIEGMVDYSTPTDFYFDLNRKDCMLNEGKDEVTAEKNISQNILSTDSAVEEQSGEKVLQPISYNCDECGKFHLNEKNLWSHLRSAHKLTSEITKSKIDKIKAELGKPKPKNIIICQICGKICSNLTRHMSTHKDTFKEDIETRFNCTLCDRNYKSKNYLKIHMKLKHIGDVKYNCQYCPKTFTTWGGHRIHTHLKHYKVKSDLQCEICKKCFPSTFTLRCHRTWHNQKNKSFQCDVCSFIFTSSGSLKDHKEEQHLNFNVKWTCDKCGTTCKTKRQLQQHIEKHLGEKNYECPVCSSVFAQNVVLRLHVEKIHPGYVLPPKGTVVSKKALEKMAMQREIEEHYVKIDFEESKINK